jgi:hypothetical protein
MEFRTFSEVAVLSCGGGGTGSVYLEAPVAAQFFQFNITSCRASAGGGAFCANEMNGAAAAFYRFRYLNVVSCSNSLSIIWNWRPALPEIEYTNFYDNKPTPLIGTLLRGKGMKIRNGVFRGNTGTFVSSDADPAFDFDFCYFSPSAPASGAATGSNCAVTVTASFWIFAINTAACPGIPTVSRSPTAAKTASATRSSGFAPSAAVAGSQWLPISHDLVKLTSLPVSCLFVASGIFNISEQLAISAVVDRSQSLPPTRTASVGCSVTMTNHFTSWVEHGWRCHHLYRFGLFVVPMMIQNGR